MGRVKGERGSREPGLPAPDGARAVRYTDATAANTTLASGAAFAPAGPSDDFGSDTDGNWTRFAQIGNGGTNRRCDITKSKRDSSMRAC